MTGAHDDAPAASERLLVEYPSSGHVRVHVPPDLPSGPAPCVLATHGYGQPVRRFLSYVRRVAPGAVVVCPEGPSSFYRTPRFSPSGRERVANAWIAEKPREPFDRRNDRFLLATLDAVAARQPLDPGRTVLLGFSQGAGVATHFLLSHPGRARGLVGLAGGLTEAYRARLPALRGKDLLWVSGTRDTAYPPHYVETLLEAFAAAGLEARHERLDAEHDLFDEAADLVRGWLAARLGG